MLYKYMYGVKLDDVLFNGESIGLCAERRCLITFDSGTSFMSVPTYAGDMMVKHGIPTKKRHVECKNPE